MVKHTSGCGILRVMIRELQPRIDENRNLLGISNTLVRNQAPLSHVRKDLAEILDGIHTLVYIPYAYGNMGGIIDRLRPEFEKVGITSVESPHYHPNSEKQVIRDAEAIFIGGGNTGRLVANLHALRNPDGAFIDQRPAGSKNALVDELRKKVAAGFPVIGSSAGLNVMCKDVRTTNDMQAAVQRTVDGKLLLRIDALGLFPEKFSVNPHYIDQVTVTEQEGAAILAINPQLRALTDHQGESRLERLSQILEMDPTRKILALREGSYIRVQGMKMEIKGTTGGVIFQSGQEPRPVHNGDRLDFLLK